MNFSLLKAVKRHAAATAGIAAIAAILAAATACAGENEWTALGPEGGAISAVIVDAATPSLMYAGTSGGGVYRSDDGGSSWKVFSEGLGIRQVGIFAQGGGTIFASSLARLYRMTGDGKWELSSIGMGNGAITSLAVSGANPAAMLAGTTAGVYLSNNGGGSWGAINTGLATLTVRGVAFDPDLAGTMYAATANGFFRTTDGGASWSAVNSGLSSTSLTCIATQPAKKSLLAGSASGLFRSVNGGDSWSQVTGPMSGKGVATILCDTHAPATVLVALSDGSAFRSDDDGDTWSPVLSGVDVRSFAADPVTSATVFAATAEGLQRSDDGGITWSRTGSGLFDRYVSALLFSGNATPSLFAGILGDKAERRREAEGWKPLSLAPTVNMFTRDPVASDTLFAATSDGIYRSFDAGESWLPGSTGIPEKNVYALAVDPGNSSVMYAGTASSAYKSSDGGNSWSPSSMGLNTGRIVGITVDPITPQKIYAASYRDDAIANPGGIYRSTDGGATWTKATTGLANLYVSALAIDPDSPSTLHVGTGAGIFRTTDGGETWSLAAGGRTTVYSLATAPGSMYAGTAGGVFRSTDGGANWSPLSRGMPTVAVTAVAADPSTTPHTLYAATAGSGVFSLQISDATAPRVSANPAGGTYGTPQTVTLTADEEGEIHYTLDGSTPTMSSPKYSEPLVIGTKKTLSFFAVDRWGNMGEVGKEEYLFDKTPPKLIVTSFPSFTNQSFLEMTGTIEAGAAVSIATDTAASDGAAEVTGTTWKYLITGLPAGETTITVTAADPAGNRSVAVGKLTVVPGLGTTDFLITPKSATGGKSEPAGTVVVPRKASQTFTFTPDEGYHLESLLVDGREKPFRANAYTFRNVRAHHLIAPAFARNVYPIRGRAGLGGSVMPGKQWAEHGTRPVMLITARPGYRISTITVNGMELAGTFASPYSLVLDATAAQKVVARFEKVPHNLPPP